MLEMNDKTRDMYIARPALLDVDIIIIMIIIIMCVLYTTDIRLIVKFKRYV
jgi:hypothetical protein